VFSRAAIFGEKIPDVSARWLTHQALRPDVVVENTERLGEVVCEPSVLGMLIVQKDHDPREFPRAAVARRGRRRCRAE
jgi:hypothetical protein